MNEIACPLCPHRHHLIPLAVPPGDATIGACAEKGCGCVWPREQSSPRIEVALCMPSIGDVHRLTVASLLKTVGQTRFPKPWHLCPIYDKVYEVARNNIVGRVLTDPLMANVTHLWWVDDDMTFEPDAFFRLLALDLPIVGGLCHGRRGPTYSPIALKRDPTTGGYKYWYDLPRDLVEVDATGAAFKIVKREVYETIEKQFPKPGEGPYTNSWHGEDVSFCERAKACGYAIYVDGRVEIGHMGEVVVESGFARHNRITEFDAYAPAADAESPLVASIVIPTFDQKREHLRSAIMSALGQTVPTEVIVVDNGSTKCLWCETPRAEAKGGGTRTGACGPDCAGAPEHPRLHLMRLDENAGHPWHATNVGFEQACGEYLAWLPSDDLLHPRKLEKQIAAMKAGGALASYTGYDVFPSNPQSEQRILMPPPVWRTWEEQHSALAHGCAINILTVLVHRSLVDRLRADGPLFDGDRYFVAADWEFMLKISAAGVSWLPVTEILASRQETGDTGTDRILRDSERTARWEKEVEEIRARYALPVVERAG